MRIVYKSARQHYLHVSSLHVIDVMWHPLGRLRAQSHDCHSCDLQMLKGPGVFTNKPKNLLNRSPTYLDTTALTPRASFAAMRYALVANSVPSYSCMTFFFLILWVAMSQCC